MEKELSKFSDDNLVDATWEEVDDFNSIMADWFETPAKIEQLGRGGFKLISQTLAEEPRFDYKRITLKFDITHSQFTSFYTAEAASQQFFEEMFEKYVSPIPSSNLVRMVIQHRLFDPKPIQIPFIGKDQFVPAIMFKMFYNTMQSKKNQDAIHEPEKDLLKITISSLDRVTGGGKRRFESDGEIIQDNYKTAKSLEEYCANQKLVAVVNYDNFCLVRAILLGKYRVDGAAKWTNRLRRGDKTLTRATNARLLAVSLLDLPDIRRGLDIGHVQMIEHHLESYQIILYGDGSRSDEPLYWNKSKNMLERKIYIVYDSDAQHFNLIGSLLTYFNVDYFCHDCQVPYKEIGRHKCGVTCAACCRKECAIVEEDTCRCKKVTRNADCRRQHEETFCYLKNLCPICNTLIVRYKPHACLNQRYCRSCKRVVDLDHLCYIMTIDELGEEKRKKFAGFIFFDFECYEEEETGSHVVNLAMAQKVCVKCIDESERCPTCILYTFYNISEFVEFMLLPENSHFQYFAHNAKSYDTQFIIAELFRRRTPLDTVPKVILNGTKILGLFYRSICVKDSSLFLPMRLAQFPQAFGLVELKKGFFPHEFNKPANQNYIGPYPAKHFYNYDYMSPAQRSEFNEYYRLAISEALNEGNASPFNFRQQFHDYCESDVRLLTEGCLSFSRSMRASSKIAVDDPGFCCLREKLTLPSACHHLYLRNYMKEKQIALIDSTAESVNSNSSRGCQEWLRWYAYKNNCKIQHAKNGGEVCVDLKTGSYKIDGVCEERRLLLEYQGCAVLGCDYCYSPTTISPFGQCLMSTLLFRTKNRLGEIREAKPGYKIVEMWEHVWTKMKKENPEVQAFMKTFKIYSPLCARDALFGGRTNCLKLRHKCSPTQQINYIDFCSLYPAVMKYGRFPIGHPEYITEAFGAFEEYYGLIKCRVLPPKHLYLPVLPAKINNKLVFCLCAVCAETQCGECKHTDEERAFVGTWCTPELAMAKLHGYTIVEMHEVWHYKSSEQYDVGTMRGGLFTRYINAALKCKQEASGFPTHVKSDEEKLAYVREYENKEGIELELGNIKHNPGMRTLSKLMLNSLWGFFALNTNKVQYEIIKDLKRWHELLHNDRFIIHSEYFKNSTIQVCYSEREEFHIGNAKTSVVVAAFVTCQARLKLFTELVLLGTRVLYFDTDSIIYIQNMNKPLEHQPTLGSFLGNFNFEKDKKSVCTVKGITFNFLASNILNYDSLTSMVCENQSLVIEIPQYKFLGQKYEWTKTTRVIMKKFRFTYTKRILCDDFTTLPFGYIKPSSFLLPPLPIVV